jgi:pimeloyl-ACP methyl ester carboxylesterase
MKMTRFTFKQTLGASLTAFGILASASVLPSAAIATTTDLSVQVQAAVHHKTVQIDGLDIFYREAGPKDAPVLLLLHGFPTSSQQYRNLIPALADKYHVIAPDYPGYGRSSMPATDEFEYSFASFASLMETFTNKLELDSYALYVMDYGAPVGYRLALKAPEKVDALIIQNGNAYDEGLLEFWDGIKAYWADGSDESREKLRGFLNVEATEWQYTHGVPEDKVALVSPDAWMLDQAYLDRPGNQEIQLDMFYNYGTNVDLYPEFQAFFREQQPPTLIVWGANDYIFPSEGATPYLRDLPDAELHLLDAGHFALESDGPEIADKIRDFLGRKLN